MNLQNDLELKLISLIKTRSEEGFLDFISRLTKISGPTGGKFIKENAYSLLALSCLLVNNYVNKPRALGAITRTDPTNPANGKLVKIYHNLNDKPNLAEKILTTQLKRKSNFSHLNQDLLAS